MGTLVDLTRRRIILAPLPAARDTGFGPTRASVLAIVDQDRRPESTAVEEPAVADAWQTWLADGVDRLVAEITSAAITPAERSARLVGTISALLYEYTPDGTSWAWNRVHKRTVAAF